MRLNTRQIGGLMYLFGGILMTTYGFLQDLIVLLGMVPMAAGFALYASTEKWARSVPER